MYYFLAFTLGIISSLHCVGMCGPIALALPVGKRTGWTRFSYVATYHSGRIGMYALLGVAVGWMGISAQLIGIQAFSSISMGLFLGVGVLLFYLAQNTSWAIFKLGRNWSQKLMSRGIQKKGYIGILGVGIANGLLPCGMVYMAITAALSSGQSIQAGLFMLIFGLGTLPAFSIVTQLSQWVYRNTRFSFHQVLPLLVLLSAFILMGRGIYFYKAQQQSTELKECR